MLRYTRLGVAFRAVVDSRPVAGLMAINTGFVSSSAWALATSFAALSGILLAPRLFLLEPAIFPPFIISFVLGAAMVGYLRSLPLAFAGGLIIGLIQGYFTQYTHFSGLLRNLSVAAPFLLMTVLVIAAPRSIRREGLGTNFMVRTREVVGQAPAAARAGLAVAVFGILALAPIVIGSVSWRLSIAQGMIFAILILSIVILSGYTGQISLGHTAFMGLAAYTTTHLATGAGLPIWIAFGLGVLAAVPAGALIGIVAVRLHGLFLALMTLALAYLANQLFFQDPVISGSEGILPMPKPTGFTSDNAFYYLALLFLIAAAVIAANLRTGRTGRVLASIRDSETATRSLGINVTKYKVIIFSLSAGMVALAGVLLDMETGQVNGRVEFIPFLSIVYVTLAVVGGIFHIGGAIAIGMFYGLFQQAFAAHPLILNLQFILFGLGATLALAQNPEGMFGEMRRGGHAILRLVARRRGLGAEPLPVTGGSE
jgi:branched-chain amino acid transport system permease protein